MQQTQRHAWGAARPIFPCSKVRSAPPATSYTESSQLHPHQFKFTCFPQLPKELQLQIWRATLPGPRVVKIRYSGVGEDARCTSIARIPVALHVCADSRQVARKIYRLSFGLEGTSHEGSHWEVEPKVWFCFERDVLFIGTEHQQPSNSLRGMSLEMLIQEAKRFHGLTAQVKDLGRVRELVVWEYLPMVALHWGEKNPWRVFGGLVGKAGGVGWCGGSWERDLMVEKWVVEDVGTWELEEVLELLTALEWESVRLIAGSLGVDANGNSSGESAVDGR